MSGLYQHSQDTFPLFSDLKKNQKEGRAGGSVFTMQFTEQNEASPKG